MALPQGALIQLPPSHADRYMRGAYGNNPAFKALFDAFTKEGFKFMYERAKVYMCLADGEGGTSAAPRQPKAYLLGILPSFIEAKATDPSHTAIGLAALSTGAAVAGRVRVEHNPFRVSQLTLHGWSGPGGVQSTSIKADDLARMPVTDAAKTLVAKSAFAQAAPAPVAEKPAPGPVAEKPAAGPVAEKAVVDLIVSSAFNDIIQDNFARPLYPPQGLKSMLGQVPVFQKFALVNSTIGVGLGGGPVAGIQAWCTCTCSNGCTTTSFTLSAAPSIRDWGPGSGEVLLARNPGGIGTLQPEGDVGTEEKPPPDPPKTP